MLSQVNTLCKYLVTVFDVLVSCRKNKLYHESDRSKAGGLTQFHREKG